MARKQAQKRPTLTVDQALREYAFPVSRNTFYRAVRTGEIPSIRFGRRIILARTAIEEFLRTGRQPVQRPAA